MAATRTPAQSRFGQFACCQVNFCLAQGRLRSDNRTVQR